MNSTKTFSGSSLHLVSGLLLAFSAYRIGTAYYAPQAEPTPVEALTLAPAIPANETLPANGVIPNTQPLPPGVQPPGMLSGGPQSGNRQQTNFNVSSLVGLSIGDIKKRLGPPWMQTGLATNPSNNISSYAFYRGAEQTLAINFDATTGKVSCLTVAAKSVEGWPAMMLVRSANLSPHNPASNYYMEMVPTLLPPQKYTGMFRSVRVKPTSDPKLKGRMMLAPEARTFRPHPSPSQGSEQQSQKFDVPRLVRLNIEEIKTELGPPLATKPDTNDASAWEATYQRGNQQLIVRYNPRTQKVVDFYLPSANPDGYVSSMRVLSGGQITDQFSHDFKLVWDYNATHAYRGVRIIPTTRNVILPARPMASPILNWGFDIPALMGLDMEKIKAKLGPSAYKYSPPPGTSTWMAAYYHGNEALFVNYNLQTNRVIDFVLAPRKNTEVLTPGDITGLMARGNLQTQNSLYHIEWLHSPKNASLYEGVKVVPLTSPSSPF